MKKFEDVALNSEVSMDLLKFRDGKMLLQANTGGGKSWAIRRIVEQTFGKMPIFLLDTEGEFYTLREKYDFILIGKDQDIVPDPKTAALLAERLIEERVSVIIDLLEMKPKVREEFVKNFVSAMTNSPRKLWLPTLLIVDEAQTYAPEGDKTECGQVLHDAAFKFRKRHFGMMFATPRISALSKNVVSTCKNKLIGYTSLDIDMKRAASELGFSKKEQERYLRDLKPGEFYAFGPAISSEVIKIQMGKVRTHHGDEGDVITKVAPASPRVKKALASLADIPQVAAEEAKTVDRLRSELSSARAENMRLARQDISPEKIEQVTKKAYDLGVAAVETTFRRQMESNENMAKKTIQELEHKLQKIGKIIGVEPLTADHGWSFVPKTSELTYDSKPIIVATPYTPTTEEKTTIQKIRTDLQEFQIGKGEMVVLNAIAAYSDGMTRTHITVQTGYKTSTRNTYIQRLLQKGFVEIKGDKVIATSEGISALGDNYSPLPTGLELIEHHLRNLPQGESTILELLINQGPLSRDAITEITHYQPSTRNTYIQRLSARQLVEIEGTVIKPSSFLL